MKYVVVAGYFDKDTHFEQCIGVFDTSREAYGEALLYLNEGIDDTDEEERKQLTISPLYEIESQTGYSMQVTGGGRTYTDYATILFFDENDDEANHHPKYIRG